MAKKTKKTKKTEPVECSIPDCPNFAEEGDTLCTFHATLADLTNDALDSAKQAFKKGDWARGLFSGFAGLVLKQEPLVKNFLGGAAQRFVQPPPPEPPPQISHWDVLGLDPATATEEDVKHVLKMLAQLYHPDKGQKGVNKAKMAEFNAAGTACLKEIRAKR